MGIRNTVKQLLIRHQDMRYKKQLARRKVDYAQWVQKIEKQEAEKLSCENTESGDDLVIWHQRQGCLNPLALAQVRQYFQNHPETILLYGDEDIQAEEGMSGLRETPWYKQEWSPDTYRSYFYLGSVIAMRRELLELAGLEQADLEQPTLEQTGLVQAEGEQPTACQQCMVRFDTAAQVRPVMDKLVTAAGGFRKGCQAIARLPHILFHVKSSKVWEEYFQCRGQEEEVLRDELVSVIIPSKDNPQVLETCIRSLKASVTDKSKIEIIVVDNGSSNENRQKVEKLTEGCTYLYQPMEFNFSKMCNLGAKQAKGSLLLFLNDDMELLENGWLDKMCQKAVQPHVGAVGLKLYYPDSIRIQHAGVTNLEVGPTHKLQFYEDNQSYYFGRNQYNQNYIAVTGACLLVESQKFWEAGGFAEELRVAYNDVELCFRLYEQGYQNVMINECHAYHHESLSRGSDEAREKQERLRQERELLYKLHPYFWKYDPYYPPQLAQEGFDNRIVPGYHTAANTVQEADWKIFSYTKGETREDNCLMVRAEITGPDRLQGYSVVLGDDNACYERYLILVPEEAVQNQGMGWMQKLEGQYRPDLEENIPDQKNVALGGFCVNRKQENLPQGSYAIGMLVKNRVTGLKLINWSGKYIGIV